MNASLQCHDNNKYGITLDISLQWRHNERDCVSNYQPHDCLLNRLFRRRSKKASKLRVTGLCEGNSGVTGEFPTQRASNAESVSIWWRHHIAVSFPNELTKKPYSSLLKTSYGAFLLVRKMANILFFLVALSIIFFTGLWYIGRYCV